MSLSLNDEILSVTKPNFTTVLKNAHKPYITRVSSIQRKVNEISKKIRAELSDRVGTEHFNPKEVNKFSPRMTKDIVSSQQPESQNEVITT